MTSAVIGIVIGIAIAFPILIFATKNILVGFYATITIVCVTVSVVAFIPMAGWKLGVSITKVVYDYENFSEKFHK